MPRLSPADYARRREQQIIDSLTPPRLSYAELERRYREVEDRADWLSQRCEQLEAQLKWKT